MKKLLLILLSSLSFELSAQSNEVFDYTSHELTKKPQPTEEFISWFKKNNEKLGKKAPESSKKSTRVTLVFIVDENGRIQNPKVWRGIGQGYDQYAHKLLKNNPNLWAPGTIKDLAVSTQVYYQLDFIKNNNSIRNKENELIE